jgi:hypothetical protein
MSVGICLRCALCLQLERPLLCLLMTPIGTAYRAVFRGSREHMVRMYGRIPVRQS